jgi:hypothetical protein
MEALFLSNLSYPWAVLPRFTSFLQNTISKTNETLTRHSFTTSKTCESFLRCCPECGFTRYFQPHVNDARPYVNDARPHVNDARPHVNDAKPHVNHAKAFVKYVFGFGSGMFLQNTGIFFNKNIYFLHLYFA